VHVAEEWRGKGIGKQMMNWAIDAAKRRGCRRVQLTTDKQRLDAHRFYVGLGFELSHEGAKLSLQ
jgi:GNAT superfamily N-acetyltransferase